jgi:response regulator RpfG family c-di-GMP phosphodiesterase
MPKRPEFDLLDVNFVPFTAARFNAGTVSGFDCYIRIRQDRYLKILQAGETFTSERLSSYLAKGVRDFFMPREAHETLLLYCDELASSLLKSPRTSLEEKSASVLNHGQQVANFLRHSGVSEKAIDHAQRFIQNAHALASNNMMISSTLKNALIFDHSVATSMIVSLLMHPLRMQGERSEQIVGLATLLRDISLVDEDPKLIQEEEGAMDPTELAAYRQHPLESALMVRGIRGIDATVVQAIEQHHERRDRSGFPNRIGALNRTAEILSMSEDFLRLILRSQKNPTLDPWLEMERAVLPRFSTELAAAFRQAFPWTAGRELSLRRS